MYGGDASLSSSGPTRFKLSRIAFHYCALEKETVNLVLHMSHPCWSLLHLPFTTSTSSSFTLPSTATQAHAAESGQHDQITHISKLSQSTSCAVKYHSGVRTCRVAESRGGQLSQGKCTEHSSRSKGKFELSFIRRSESFGETRRTVFI